jgi:hypothetical protein
VTLGFLLGSIIPPDLTTRPTVTNVTDVSSTTTQLPSSYLTYCTPSYVASVCPAAVNPFLQSASSVKNDMNALFCGCQCDLVCDGPTAPRKDYQLSPASVVGATHVRAWRPDTLTCYFDRVFNWGHGRTECANNGYCEGTCVRTTTH